MKTYGTHNSPGRIHIGLRRVAAATLLALGCLAGWCAGAESSGHAHDAHELEISNRDSLGTVSFPTSCSDAVAADIEHGIALLHSFGYTAAEQQFQRVAQQDPSCAMAHWCVAMTHYREIWSAPDAGDMTEGRAQMAQAQVLAQRAPVSAREQAYLDALDAFFAPGDTDFQHRAEAYRDSMDQLRAAYPEDLEAAAFDALAILAAIAPEDTSLVQERRALDILQPLFEAHPEHPGLAHYIIHTCDTPALAQEGLAAARRYAAIAPASAHALHMPAHIFARLGMWREDIASNEASVRASRRAQAAGRPGASHQLHADQFLVYAYLQTGQTAKAKALTDRMAGIGRELAAMPGKDDMKSLGHHFDNQLRTIFALETHQWRELARLQPAPGSTSYEAMVIAWGQGVAAGHLKDARLAALALEHYDQGIEALKSSPYPDAVVRAQVRRDQLLGWQAMAEGKPDDAIAALRRAADQQDKLGQGEVDIPAREMLADALVMLKRPAAALVEYREALRLSPNRLDALRQGALAADAAGEPAQAREYRKQVAEITRPRRS